MIKENKKEIVFIVFVLLSIAGFIGGVMAENKRNQREAIFNNVAHYEIKDGHYVFVWNKP